MKYARKKTYGNQTRLIDAVDIPSPLPSWASDVDAFLAKMFPGYTGWVQVPDECKSGDVDNGNGTYTAPIIPAPPAEIVLRGMTWDALRSLFTVAELEALDSFEDATYLGALNPAISLTAGQRAKIRSFIAKGIARGADRAIDVTTNGMDSALDYLEARGFIASGRKAEIMAGTVKS